MNIQQYREKYINDTDIVRVIKLLEEAYAHLEFCGYGDAWERQCAELDRLPERLQELFEGDE